MESLPCFRLVFRDALRFSPVFPPNNPSRAARGLSGWGRPLLAVRRPRRRVEGTEAPSSRGEAHSQARQEEEGRLDSNPRPVPNARPAGPLMSKFWHQFRKQNTPPKSEEFVNLRNDDFPRKKKPIRRNPFSVQRTEGSEVLFGVAPCGLALRQSRRSFFQLFLKQSGDGASPVLREFSRQAHDRGIPTRWVGQPLLDNLCGGGVHQGVCLEATPLRPVGWQEGPPLEGKGAPTAAGKGSSQVLWLVLERILDPMNLGAILRSAHFLGVDRIVMSQKNSCPLTPTVSKASSGAMEVLNVFATNDLQSFLKTKSEQGWEILGTVGAKGPPEDVPVESCLDFHWTRPTVLVMGNEGSGLSPAVRGLCQRMLTVAPGRELEPGIECLNVSVAAGIILHSICRQKIKAP